MQLKRFIMGSNREYTGFILLTFKAAYGLRDKVITSLKPVKTRLPDKVCSSCEYMHSSFMQLFVIVGC